MIDPQEVYCKLFINYDGGADTLIREIALLIDGKVKLRRYINSKLLDICVQRNDSHNDPKYGKPIPWGTLNEFLYYKYFLETFPKDEDVNKEEYEKEVGNLLEKLWSKGYKAVAACGFEEKLPHRGGMGFDPAVAK